MEGAGRRGLLSLLKKGRITADHFPPMAESGPGLLHILGAVTVLADPTASRL